MMSSVIVDLICAHQVRRLLGDFGVPIAIFLMIVMDYAIDDTYTQVGSYKQVLLLILAIKRCILNVLSV